MELITIDLSSAERAKSYLEVCEKFQGDIDLITSTATVDGKSAMGIFAANLSLPVKTRIITADPEEEKRFIECMEEFK